MRKLGQIWSDVVLYVDMDDCSPFIRRGRGPLTRPHELRGESEAVRRYMFNAIRGIEKASRRRRDTPAVNACVGAAAMMEWKGAA